MIIKNWFDKALSTFVYVFSYFYLISTIDIMCKLEWSLLMAEPNQLYNIGRVHH